MENKPFQFSISFPACIPSRVDNHIERRLSSLEGQFLDQKAYRDMLGHHDPIVYEVYEIKRPEIEGEILMGISVVHPGKVGEEFFMTKGHFHTVVNTAEVYYCLQGEGCMVMETWDGETSVEDLSPGKVLYVPPGWAHRSICTSKKEDLITFFAYPGNAGHNYAVIEERGFRKLVIDCENLIKIIDNPRCG